MVTKFDFFSNFPDNICRRLMFLKSLFKIGVTVSSILNTKQLESQWLNTNYLLIRSIIKKHLIIEKISSNRPFIDQALKMWSLYICKLCKAMDA